MIWNYKGMKRYFKLPFWCVERNKMKHQWFELGFYRSQSGACLSIKGTDWNFKFHLVPFWANKRNKMKPYQVEKALQMIYALMWQLHENWVYEPVSLNIRLMWQKVSISSFPVSNSVFYLWKREQNETYSFK